MTADRGHSSRLSSEGRRCQVESFYALNGVESIAGEILAQTDC
jgi:hypothetical protein